ncbi:unnamed protein product [Closterium sp. NIES-54]
MVSSPPPIFCSFSRNPFALFSSSSSRHLPSSPPLSPCQRISAELDPRAGRVCLRVPTPRDLDFALSRHPALAQLPMLSFAEFERVTRCVLKRVAADRGRRLLLFVTGGVIGVQMAKGTIRKVPLVGGLVAALVSIVFPTSVVGPALGVAGALYVEQPRQLLH